jgi:hypothetical protein
VSTSTTTQATRRGSRWSARLAVPIALVTALATAGVLLVAAPASAHPVLHISATPTTVVAGQSVTLTISGTSNGNYTNARIEVFSSTPSGGGTTGDLTAFSSSPTCGGSPGTVTCTENPSSRYRIGNINLTNNQAFSYTVTFTIDPGTAAGTFTSKAQFYKSDNTTDGPTTGPLITVVEPTDFSVAVAYAQGGLLTNRLFVDWSVTNAGPGSATAATVQTTRSTTGTTTVLAYADAFSKFGCAFGSGSVVGNCTLTTVPLASGGAGRIYSSYELSLLATGSITFTTTVTSLTDTNPANDSASTTCSFLLGVVSSCTPDGGVAD